MVLEGMVYIVEKKVEKNEVNKNEIDMSDVKEGTQN